MTYVANLAIAALRDLHALLGHGDDARIGAWVGEHTAHTRPQDQHVMWGVALMAAERTRHPGATWHYLELNDATRLDTMAARMLVAALNRDQPMLDAFVVEALTWPHDERALVVLALVRACRRDQQSGR